MRGYIEVKDDTYEDTIEHLHRIKLIACKLIKKLSEHSEVYEDEKRYYDEDMEPRESEGKRGKGRYEY